MNTITQTMECVKCDKRYNVPFIQNGFISIEELAFPGCMWSNSDEDLLRDKKPIPRLSIANIKDVSCPSCGSFMRRL